MAAHKLTRADKQRRVIVSARTFKGLTQEKIARKLGISVSAYSYIERDIGKADFSRVAQICKMLNVDLSTLADIEE